MSADPPYAKPPQLIALDIDGTLVDARLTLAEADKAAIAAARSAGSRVVLFTGRMFAASVRFAQELELDGPLVCYQGAACYDVASRALLWEEPVPAERARRVVDRVLADGFHAQAYFDDRLYVQSINHWSRVYTNIAAVEPVLVASLDAAITRPSTKVVAVGDPARMEEYARTLAQAFPDLYVTRSQPEFVEVLSRLANKGDAMRRLVSSLGVDPISTIAVGDSWNDLPLLGAAGFGVAMGSAPPELKALAGAVVPPVAAHGVSQALREFAVP
ncbi:Cof-type HAD-IIB family hydrolase [bacterium]|nr:MAG: Cof-type HAD-IIB family hydrolase [bacterium]